jgi:hypothetical protein
MMGGNMKYVLMVCMNVILVSAATGQSESIIISKQWTDTLIVVENMNAIENCAARFAIEVSVQGFEITIVETDTVVEKEFCECAYNLFAYLRGLPPGTYIVNVFRQYWKKYTYPEDRKVLIGSASFDVAQPALTGMSAAVHQSSCLSTGVWSPRQGGGLTVAVFPNPAVNDVTVHVNPDGAQNVTLILFDALGKEVTRLERHDADGEVVLIFPAGVFLRSGIYYCRVLAGSSSKVVLITIIR